MESTKRPEIGTVYKTTYDHSMYLLKVIGHDTSDDTMVVLQFINHPQSEELQDINEPFTIPYNSIHQSYKICKAYNTPLWKALNG